MLPKTPGANGRKTLVSRRVRKIIGGFDNYLRQFDRNPAFTKPGQYESHAQTMKLRRECGSVSAALQSDNFLQNLWFTLAFWGIGSRASKLAPLNDFVRLVRAKEAEICALEGQNIDGQDLDVDGVSNRLWELIDSLAVVENEATLVAGTKTLHHILPELVVPMDRTFTRTFFGWHGSEFQYQQARLFRHAFGQFATIARATNPARYVGEGWRTSRTKVIDNALVAFCRVEKLPLPS